MPIGGDVANIADTGAVSVAAGTRHPATATATSAPTSITVSAFCVRADACRPAILTAVSATTMPAAHTTDPPAPSGTTRDMYSPNTNASSAIAPVLITIARAHA